MQLPDLDKKTRLDKWLWAARFFKTRSLATEIINKGQVLLNQSPAKPAREVQVGDRITLLHDIRREVEVLSLSITRGPASIAQGLYAETPESTAFRKAAAEQRRLAPEPAHSIEHGRPTKRDRRDLERSKDWNDRWSASL